MNEILEDEVRVIVVDDNPDAADSLAELIRLNGYRVWTASDGESALELTNSTNPNCVLFDIRMPGMGGLELARQLRAKYRDEVVLIATTGSERTSPDVVEVFNLVDHYFCKPFDAAELEKVLRPIN
jgi:DNA-binding response OmpR family regulator